MPMPYTLAKGTILSTLEDVVNADTPSELNRLQLCLDKLRDPNQRLTSIIAVDALELNPPAAALLTERLETNWFGRTWNPSAATWADQPGFSVATPTTGYFRRYHGDVEGVLRETLIRTIEIAFGLDHGANLAPGGRHWPIDLLWKCPNPWFEGWVTWRRHGANPSDGQVTTIIASPAEAANPVVDTISQPLSTQPPLPSPTALPTDHQGMFVIAQHKHERHNVDTMTQLPEDSFLDDAIDNWMVDRGLPAGTWTIPLPSTTFVGVGAVDVVHVPEASGGAAPFGRHYAP